jgi:hypothetical protein
LKRFRTATSDVRRQRHSTSDDVDEARCGDGRFKRTGYVGVLDITEPELGRQGYRFRFLKRYPRRR